MYSIWMMCCFLTVFQGFAQTKTVTGTVTDGQTGEEIVGASISIVGSTKGTVTDINGRFSLPDVTANAVLTVSYIGYVQQR
ncbi:MAG: carboxypeptidase-like regulatory domain-containing protein, partial [Tannerella sp.]|nr:carboxypeptidase-like regulatory domain-containing protein [Tannerella sp.]